MYLFYHDIPIEDNSSAAARVPHVCIEPEQCFVYLAILVSRDDRRGAYVPDKVFKPGITSMAHPLLRLAYRNQHREPHPISDFFLIAILTFLALSCRSDSQSLENHIQETTKGEKERYFKNWWCAHKISGITELRLWDKMEVEIAFDILETVRIAQEEADDPHKFGRPLCADYATLDSRIQRNYADFATDEDGFGEA